MPDISLRYDLDFTEIYLKYAWKMLEICLLQQKKRQRERYSIYVINGKNLIPLDTVI